MLVHDKRIQTWDQQVIDDTQAQEEEWQNIQEQEDQLCAQKEQDLESDWQEAEKKKLKMNSFNKDSMVHDFLTPQPSAYTLCCLKEFNYVELWYFTQEGCADVSQNQHTQNKDTIGLTKVNNMVSLRLVASPKASKNVIQDINLTWHQMAIAKTILIQ